MMLIFSVSLFFVPGIGRVNSEDSSANLWASEERLGSYQNAWETLNKSAEAVYYEVKTTNLTSGPFVDNTEKIRSTNYTCWKVQYQDLDQIYENGTRVYDYLRTADSQIFFIEEPVRAVKALNYSTNNGVQYELTSERTETDPVIFTDGVTCDLFNVPRNNEGKGCELWVSDKYKNNIPPCCSFIFDLLCAGSGSYDVYDSKMCKDLSQN